MPPLPDAAQLAQLTAVAPLPWLKRVLADWAVIVVAYLIAWWADHPAGFLLVMPIIAVQQHALAILAHDGAHRLVSRTRWLNDFLTNLFCFWPLGFPLGGYRRFHFQHHRETGTADDPELRHKQVFKQWALPLRPAKLAAHITTDVLGGGIPHLVMAAYLTRAVGLVDGLLPILFWTILGLSAWALDSLWIVGLWWASLIFCLWPIFRLRMWTEHVGTTGAHRITAGLLARLLIVPHHTYMHWEHHVLPTVPCWKLPQLRRCLADPPIMPLSQLFRSYLFTAETRVAEEPTLDMAGV